MAADWDKEAKTFVVAEGKTGNKHDRFGGLFGRRRIVDKKAGKATDHRSAFFGLWSKDDTYSLVETSKEKGAVYRRTHKTSSNGFRTKDTEYYPDRGKKSEDRRYLGGLFTSGVGYDTDGEIIRRSDGDFMGKTTWRKSTDSRTQTFEQDDLFGWYRKKQESLALPGDTAVKWRTMERRIGSYEMTIKTSDGGTKETRTHGFGRALGKTWLFSRTSVYDFKTGEKTTTYKGLFGLLDRGGERKGRPISPKEMQKYQERVAQKEKVADAWERHALGLSDTASVSTEASDHRSMFQEKLRDIGSDRAEHREEKLSAWLDNEAEVHKETLAREKSPDRSGRRVSFGKELDPVGFDESASATDSRPATPIPLGTPRLHSLDYGGVTLPPDTPPHLLPEKGRKLAKLKYTSWEASSADPTDSDDGTAAPAKRTRLNKPVPSKEAHPADKGLAGIVAETAPAPVRKAATLKNSSWHTGAAVQSDSEDSAAETPAKRARRSTPSPIREGHPSDKNLAGIVDAPAERRRAPAATLKNSSWGTGVADLPDSDDESVRSVEPYRKEKRAPVDRSFDRDRSSERDRESVSSLGSR